MALESGRALLPHSYRRVKWYCWAWIFLLLGLAASVTFHNIFHTKYASRQGTRKTISSQRSNAARGQHQKVQQADQGPSPRKEIQPRVEENREKAVGIVDYASQKVPQADQGPSPRIRKEMQPRVEENREKAVGIVDNPVKWEAGHKVKAGEAQTADMDGALRKAFEARFVQPSRQNKTGTKKATSAFEKPSMEIKTGKRNASLVQQRFEKPSRLAIKGGRKKTYLTKSNFPEQETGNETTKNKTLQSSRLDKLGGNEGNESSKSEIVKASGAVSNLGNLPNKTAVAKTHSLEDTAMGKDTTMGKNETNNTWNAKPSLETGKGEANKLDKTVVAGPLTESPARLDKDPIAKRLGGEELQSNNPEVARRNATG